MADFTGPNNLTKEYVRSHRRECLSHLKEDNLLVIRYVQQKKYTVAIAGLDQILNGLMTIQNSKQVIADLKKIYTAVTLDEAESNLLAFEERWRGKYSSCVKIWEDNWEVLTAFFREALNKSPHPSWRQIFRPASLKNLEIHKVFLRFFASQCMKICSPIRAR